MDVEPVVEDLSRFIGTRGDEVIGRIRTTPTEAERYLLRDWNAPRDLHPAAAL